LKVAITSLQASQTPRIFGENPEHVRALAEAEGRLPPIIVHRPTLRVIDGMHRLRAAELRRQDEIEVRFFNGSEADAFILAVRSNIAHGLPLSLADRKAAALRIITSKPHWSDRLIADRTGLAAKTIAAMRRGHSGTSAQQASRPDARVGQDGRVRPMHSTAGRQLASELMTDNPNLSLRQVAGAAGISPETVRAVRDRLRRGENPVPPRQGDRRNDGTYQRASPADHKPQPAPSRPIAAEPAGGPIPELPAVIRQLEIDPAFRFNDTGRALLKILYANAVIDNRCDRILENVPDHCRGTVATAARKCAQVWRSLAAKLEPPQPVEDVSLRNVSPGANRDILASQRSKK
jgi:ParB-like chromosome segregation protein Spo0J